MAQIRFLTCMAGSDFVHNAGDVVECSDAQAQRFADAGIAEIIESQPKIERATAKRKVETTTKAE